MGSIIGQKIDYNGVGALRGQRHIPSKYLPKYPPPPPPGSCATPLAQFGFISTSTRDFYHYWDY